MRYTFVTVVYEDEYDVLLLQARSMRIYCERAVLEKIIIIDNSQNAMPRKWATRILDEYGDIRQFAQILRPSDFASMPRLKGWTSQQLLKLAISRLVVTDRYVLLDAKNQLISPLTRAYLETEHGLARANGYCAYGPIHPLRSDLERTLTYFGLDHQKYLARFTGATTPFTMHTKIVHQLMDQMQEKEGVTFEQAFAQYRPTEFFGYACHIIKSGIEMESLYDLSQPPTSCIWVHAANYTRCKQTIASATNGKSPFFGLHRAALIKLPSDSRRELASFLASRALFESENAASSFLLKVRIKLILRALSKPVRRLPENFVKKLKRIFGITTSEIGWQKARS